MKRAILLGVLCVVSLGAQAPALTDLEACRVDVSLQNEAIVRLKIQLADLQKQYDVVQLQLDRQQRTPPPRDGFVWQWEIDAKTGQPKGYVKEAARPTVDKE